MTSVRNHRPPLNGSSIPGLVLMLCLFIACGTPKGVTKKPTDSKPPVKEADDKVRIYDPASGTYVLVPRDAVKVDTVKWTEDKSEPLVTDKEVIKGTPEKKSKYEISLLVPLNSESYPSLDGYLDPKLVRFMQYYGGMRIAAEDIASMGLPVTFRSFDTETTINRVNEILKDPNLRNADVIVGPYEKDHVDVVASYGQLNKKFVVSPWLPAFNTENENPFFLQVLPGISTHAAAIMDFIDDDFGSKKVFLVARNNPAEIQRLMLFKKNSGVVTEDLIIDDESIDLASTKLSFLLDDPDGSVFVLPYYSRQDETFVNSFLRKLLADKGTKDVIVFGLPQWIGFNNLNPNYMEGLSVHISSSTYVDTRHSSYSTFRNKFFQQYLTMPDNQAYQGYDLLMWIAKTISNEGLSGLVDDTPAFGFGIASGFNLKPIYKDVVRRPTEIKTPLYYENTKVRILKFTDQDFELVR